jgi:hypothetical protein
MRAGVKTNFGGAAGTEAKAQRSTGGKRRARGAMGPIFSSQKMLPTTLPAFSGSRQPEPTPLADISGSPKSLRTTFDPIFSSLKMLAGTFEGFLAPQNISQRRFHRFLAPKKVSARRWDGFLAQKNCSKARSKHLFSAVCQNIAKVPAESGGGPPQSKTLARGTTASEIREASWSAPVLWRFGRACGAAGTEAKAAAQHRRKGAGARREGWPIVFSHG